MRILAISFIVAAFVACAHASWPFMDLDPAEVEREPERALDPVLNGHEYIYLSSPDFRKATIRFNKEAKEYHCHFPVSYVEAIEWIALSHTDHNSAGWTSLPKALDGDKWHECKGIAQLLAILDQAAIGFDRTTSMRCERETDKFLAAWNHLEFRVPLAKKDSLITFLRYYLGGYAPETKIGVYNTQS